MSDNKELLAKLELNEAKGNYEEVINDLENIRVSLRNEMNKCSDDKLRLILDKTYKLYTIRLYDNKIKTAKTKENEFYFRGKLIKLLKDYKNTATKDEINFIRAKLDKELVNHKELSKSIRLSKKDSIKLSDKIGLKIQEISNTIQVFLSKHDVINKIKNSFKSTIFGGSFTIGMEAVVSLLIGGGLSSTFLIGALPILGYIGISSLVKNIFTKSSYQKFTFKNSDEYIDSVKNIPVDFKEEFISLNKLLEEKNNADNYEKTKINQKLINLYDEVINKTKVDELKKTFKLEKHNLLLENKKVYENMIDKHIKNQSILSKKLYQEIVKNNLKNDISIFESENSIKEATSIFAKKSGLDIVTLVISRIIASAVIPGYALTSIKDLLIPLGFMISNNLIEIINYKDKLINSKYNNKKVKINDLEKFEKIAKVNNNILSLATS